MTDTQRSRIEVLSQDILDARTMFPDSPLDVLYDSDAMPPALRTEHRSLDRAVDQLYRRSDFASERERVEHLSMLYEKIRTPLGIGMKTRQKQRRSRV